MNTTANQNKDLGLANRLEILETALTIERLTSVLLASLLDIKNYSNSNTLGDKGGSLSFNQKINLLIEIGALDKKEKNKFQTFMEIRNIFMHNISADTFENCFSKLPKGKIDFLIKTFPEVAGTREEQFRKITIRLCEEITCLTIEVIKKIKEKAFKSSRSEFLMNSNQAFLEAIEELRTNLDEYFKSEIAKGSTYNVKRLKGFGSNLSKVILSLWKGKMKNRNNFIN